MAERAPIAGLILAAGGAARMGRAKQLLDFDGKPMLQVVVDAATASVLGDIVVVTGCLAEQVESAVALPERGRFVHCARYRVGQSASLQAGVAAVRDSSVAVAVLLADQPQVTSALINRVANEFLASGAACARPVYSAAGNRVPGHPVFLARSIWPYLEELTSDRGARDLLAKHPEWVVEVPIRGEAPIDVDTPSDYEALVAK